MFRGRRPPQKRPPKVGVLTTTGGGGAAACDQLAFAGVDLLTPNDATVARILATGIDVSQGPLTDLTLAGARADIIGPSVEAIAADPDCDIVLCVLGSSSRAAPQTALPPVIEADVGDKLLAAFLVPDAADGLRLLIDKGVPAFRTPESCADVVRAYCRWAPPRLSSRPAASNQEATRTLDEHASLRLLADCGVPTAASVRIDLAELDGIELPFDYPVAAKVLSDEIAHKTDVGGVVVGIRDRAELQAAAALIRERVEAAMPGVKVEAIIVEPMITGLQEVLVGYRHDDQVGPVITVAPGGINVGVYDDKAVRLAPVDKIVAREMIDEVVGFASLRGHRNLPPGDIEALADVIVRMSELAGLADVRVIEAEANPVIVGVDGATAVDGLVRLAT
jgi:acyl-CoA synthetase (NDP forming)